VKKIVIMKKNTVLIISILLITVSASAQFDSIVNTFQQDFDQFRQDIEKEHRQFLNKNDSVFAKFLKDSWEDFEVFYKEVQEPPKPVVQPKMQEEPVPEPKELKPAPPDSAKIQIMPDEKIEKTPEKTPAEAPENFGRAMIHFDFYGAETETVYPGNLPVAEQIDEETIEMYFEKACNLVAVHDLVEELQQKKKRMRLNDWGYYKLVEVTARLLEPVEHRQVLLTWVLMLKSGYNAKVGFNTAGIYLMFPAREEIFSSLYFTMDGTPYYIQTNWGKNKPLPQMRVHRANYPGNKRLSMRLTEIPLLGEKPVEREIHFQGDTIRVTSNEYLARFYNDYPLCNLEVFFSTPLSGSIIQPVERCFFSKFSGKTDFEKVALLLNFVQNAFEYKTDGDQFGREKYFFPDEVFYYPFSDCEDRSVLFARLVKHFTERDCIGLDFPGHVNTAVHFYEEVDGSFIEVDNKKFMVCDPTYQNAPVGYLDARYKKYQPGIVTVIN
jgi:hypothetical protein